jgi:hypothetical protein
MTSIPGGQVSASKFSTAFGRAGCGMKFYYRYIEGIKGAVNASLLTGIAFDEATRQYHDNLIAGTLIEDPEVVFTEAWNNPPKTNKDGEVIEYDLGDQPDDLIGSALHALAVYEQTTKDTIKPIATQVYVEQSFEETDAKLIGYIDLIEAADSGICVSDIKTSISPRKKWTEADAARDAQLGIYSLLADGDVTTVGWRHARIGGKVEVGATHVAAPKKEVVLARVTGWMNTLEAWCQTGNFPPTGLDRDAWVCSEKYCDYYHRCEFGSKSQSVIPVNIGGTK